MIKRYYSPNKGATLLAILCLLPALSLTVGALPSPLPEITAETAVLMDADTGQVLYDKNMHVQRAPASTTKIMTGLLVLENCAPADTVTVSETAVDIPYDSSHEAMSPGEEMPVDSAMYAMMMRSANEATNALAEHVAGSQAAFARMMTQRAQELGAQNTNFANAHGLDDSAHYTTAYDLALITRQAIRTSGFLKYYGAGRHTIPATNLQEEERPFTNQQFMLLPDQWVYNPEVIGGKVGYTQEARHTMSTAAVRGDRTLVAVVLGCGVDEKFYDTQALFDYGFDSFDKVTVPAGQLEEQRVPVLENGERVGQALFSVEQDAVSVLLPSGLDVQAISLQYNVPEAVQGGEEAAGSVAVTLQSSGEVLLELPLTATVTADALPAAPPAEEQPSGRGLLSMRTWRWPLLAVAVLTLLVLVRKIQIARRRARRIRRRQALRERMQQQGADHRLY